MPMPFNPPSPVLFELLQWLTLQAKGVITTAEEKIADVNSNTPVGTTQALIEQGAAVFSSIHARLHESQAKVLKILSRINRWYLDDMRKGEIVEDLEIRREDFARMTDVVPVSDPHIFSETQRMAQTQAVMSLMEKNPDLFNRRAVLQRFLKQIKVPGINELMTEVPSPEKADAATENVAMTIGQAAFAFPEQDHLAHIQVHLDYAKDPTLGSNPMIAGAYLPKAMEHIKQHIVLWYLNRMNGYATQALGKEVKNYEIEKDPKMIDKLFAAASKHITMDTQETLGGIVPVIQQMLQTMEQFKPKPPMDASTQVLMQTSMAETQRRAQRDQAEIQIQQQKAQMDAQEKMARMQMDHQIATEDLQLRLAIATGDNETKERIETARLTRDAARLSHDQQKTAIEFAKGGLVQQGGQYGYE
jgi:hypothetical protein